MEELTLWNLSERGIQKPVFAARNVELISGRILGKNRNVLKLQVKIPVQTARRPKREAVLPGSRADAFLLEERYGKRLWIF